MTEFLPQNRLLGKRDSYVTVLLVKRRPELVVPAGNMDCVRAAVGNGADAVYFGLRRFNARMRAENFTEEQLPELVGFLHGHGCRAIAALNILIFPGELTEAERQLHVLDAAGVDAVMVQDLGLAALAQRLGLRMEVHASTQMTVTNPEAAKFLAGLGIRRVVLARELSLEDLAKFDPSVIELEVFVHGALCIAYSGQCLTSEALGQRSANRGECAAACRLPYELIVDGAPKDLGGRRYLLSPQDLAAVREIPELVRLGVAAFKIEGRLKSPEYVAATTQVYRRLIDQTVSGQKVEAGADDWYKLEMVFSRGFCSGWLRGPKNRELVKGWYGTKRGPFVGEVRAVGPSYVAVSMRCPIRAGDGVLIEGKKEQGGRVWEVRGDRLYFEHGKIQFRLVRPGDRVWKTSDPHLEKELRRTFAAEIPRPKKRLDVRVSGCVGEPLVLEAGGVTVRSAIPLQAARNRPLTSEILHQQLGRLGGTDFTLGQVCNLLSDNVILPVSELNRLRRELVAKLNRTAIARESPQGVAANPVEQISLLEQVLPRRGVVRLAEVHLIALCRTLEQLGAALDFGCKTVYADFEDIRRYADAVALARSHAGRATIFLAPPRVLKPGEQALLKAVSVGDGILIRSLGSADWPGRKIGDYSLNVANALSAQLLIQNGLERVTASYDLNGEQV
ncbi:MAG: U32 family peptidase, partial [Verrucomicrobiae bacterium]|nr:U32 family peptidase [Verrucomicrobiae bacterium]